MNIGRSSVFGLLSIGVAIIIYFIFSYFPLQKEQDKDGFISCAANFNINLSDGVSLGPVINGVLYLNLKGEGEGLLELSGIVRWHDEQYAMSRRIYIKHDFHPSRIGSLVTLQTVKSFSLEHDTVPQGVIEKYLIGDPSLPARIVRFKRSFDNGYVISNLNSPVMICIDR